MGSEQAIHETGKILRLRADIVYELLLAEISMLRHLQETDEFLGSGRDWLDMLYRKD
jgi:hypothetical protein